MTLEQAIAFAAQTHAGQKDKGGGPYILHPLRVMLAVAADERTRIAAVLHDVVEDTSGVDPLSRLARLGASRETLADVAALTRRNGESYESYVERVALSPVATAVKLADLADNRDLRRLGREPTEEDWRRLAKYDRALRRLREGQWPSAEKP